MKKKGFTLVELLAVIVVLGIILVIAIPNILDIINKAKIDSYNSQMELIKNAAAKYAVQYASEITNPNNATVTLNTLISKGLIDSNIKNPITNQALENVSITLKKTNNGTIYGISETPKLVTGMIPVYYNGTNWVKADSTNPNNSWYDYAKQQWANVVTVTSTNRATYQSATVGTVIPMTDINTMFVWIPRYKYLIPAGAGAREIDIIFESKYTLKSNGDAVDTYYTHPAFTFGTDELSGIWVGKFETTGAAAAITIKPNLTSLANQTISTMFNAVRGMPNVGNSYGFTITELDTHLMKNMEWGAVAFLSHSKYGKNAEVWINPANNYTTGCAGDSASSAATTGCLRTYETTNGLKASTTGNIYGIYDMSGGTYEYVMGNYNNTISNSGFGAMPSSKYYDLYTNTTTGLKGDATNADSTANWYGDYNFFVTSGSPWFLRDGYYGDGANAGIFGFAYGMGNGFSSFGFRITIASN